MQYLTAEQMRQVDDLAINYYNITLLQMMELAGSNLSTLAKQIIKAPIKDSRITVLAGKGNNGGGGLVAARHLVNTEANTKIILAQEHGLKPAVVHQLKTLKKMKVDVSVYQAEILGTLEESDLIIDALLGYNIVGDPRPPISEIITETNMSSKPVLSLDLPSGLDATKGTPGTPCINASTTMTLALPKTGFTNPYSREYVGDLYLTDIGIPNTLYEQMGLKINPLFDKEKIIKIK